MKPMTALAGGFAVLSFLAGCDSGAPVPETTNITVPQGDYQARLAQMPEGQRNAVFLRAIRDAGRDCQHVQTSAAASDLDGTPAWTATCDNGVRWLILIGADGIAQVTNAVELQAARAAAEKR